MLSFSTLAREVANSSLSHLIQHEKFFEENTTFDITIAMAVGFSETSYYVAWKFNSTLALYFAQQMALSTQSWALGQPHNPAYIPMIGMEFTHPMNFWQRCINLVMTVSLTLMRDYFTVPHLEDILDYHFPEDKGRRPPLLQLEKEAGLAFQFGHPLIMDGARPVSPNYVMIGNLLGRAKRAE